SNTKSSGHRARGITRHVTRCVRQAGVPLRQGRRPACQKNIFVAGDDLQNQRMQISRKRISRRVLVLILLVLASEVIAAEKSTEVPLPEGYQAWQHVKSEVVGPEHKSFAKDGGKVYHFYANPQAIDGYRTGKFPNGSVLVRETLRTVPGEGESKGILNEGE